MDGIAVRRRAIIVNEKQAARREVEDQASALRHKSTPIYRSGAPIGHLSYYFYLTIIWFIICVFPHPLPLLRILVYGPPDGYNPARQLLILPAPFSAYLVLEA